METTKDFIYFTTFLIHFVSDFSGVLGNKELCNVYEGCLKVYILMVITFVETLVTFGKSMAFVNFTKVSLSITSVP